MEPTQSDNSQPQPSQQPQAQWQPPATPPTWQPQASESEELLDPAKVKNPIGTLRPGEKVICDIRRHPIGIIGIYIGAIIFFLLFAVLGYIVLPDIMSNYSKNKIYGYSTLVLLCVALVEILFVYISNVVYKGNRWIVTDDSVTQITQVSLFSKRNSQLSMANLEDVSSEKNGILPQIFNYGVLKAETAGAQVSKFHLTYCPNPDYYARCILRAREEFEDRNYRAAQAISMAQQQPYQQQPPVSSSPQSPQPPQN